VDTSELHNGWNWILRNEDRAFFQLAIGDVYRLPGEDLPFSYQEWSPPRAHWAIRIALSRCKSTNGLDGFNVRRSSHQTLLLYRLSKRRELLSLEVRIKRNLALVSSSSAKAKI